MKPEGEEQTYLGVSVFEGTYRYMGMKLVPSWRQYVRGAHGAVVGARRNVGASELGCQPSLVCAKYCMD